MDLRRDEVQLSPGQTCTEVAGGDMSDVSVYCELHTAQQNDHVLAVLEHFCT